MRATNGSLPGAHGARRTLMCVPTQPIGRAAVFHRRGSSPCRVVLRLRRRFGTCVQQGCKPGTGRGGRGICPLPSALRRIQPKPIALTEMPWDMRSRMCGQRRNGAATRLPCRSVEWQNGSVRHAWRAPGQRARGPGRALRTPSVHRARSFHGGPEALAVQFPRSGAPRS